LLVALKRYWVEYVFFFDELAGGYVGFEYGFDLFPLWNIIPSNEEKRNDRRV